MTRGDVMSVIKEHIDKVVWSLDAAFVFADTPQGAGYWYEVHRNLRELQSRGVEMERREGERRDRHQPSDRRHTSDRRQP